MTLERDEWQRVDALLQAALDRPSQERKQWLEDACGGDAALRDRVAERLRLATAEGDGLMPGAALGARATETGGVSSLGGNAPLLAPGHLLGRFEIKALLGEGGMGRVYCALDPVLGREVAIKALGHAFREDSASLKRFEREARLLATMSHPNIAAIYGFELLDGAPYLILERIEGGTLADKLRGGRLALREVLAIAIQVADGLLEAHAKGVTHRDLKPSNVMLAASGRVKLVDFGVAKRAEPQDVGDSGPLNPTTAAGVVLGTAPYMSPEQIRGQDVDTRTDVWAFGCLLYEMLAGRSAFGGRSAPEALAAVLRDDPDWSALPSGLHPIVRRLLERCLRKDPQMRLQHIGDARIELVELGTTTETEEERPPPKRRRVLLALPWALAGGLALVLGLTLAYMLPNRGRASGVGAFRLSLDLPSKVMLSSDYSAPFAVAPEGSPLALVGVEEGTTRLYVRSLADLALRVLPGTEGARQPFFSPDGRWLAFFADRKLEKVPVDGGPVLPLCEIGNNPRGAAWALEGTIVLAPTQRSGLTRVSDGGGQPVPLTTLDAKRGEYSHRWPQHLPGGRFILFTSVTEDSFSFDEARLEAVSLETGERRVILNGAGYGRYVGNRRLVFARSGRLYSVAFDPARLETEGAPEPMLVGVRYDPQNGAAHLAASGSGVLVYGPGVPTSPEHYLSWLEHDGRLTRLLDAPRMVRDPRLGPDGQRVAVLVGTSAESDLWLVEANGTLSQLSFGLSPHRPTWTADGRRITVGVEKNGTWRLISLPVEGGEPEILLESPQRVYPNAWSPDGRRLVFQEQRPQTGWDLLVLEVDQTGRPEGPPKPLAASPFHESNAALSADGRWLAYESDELDSLVQAYVRRFPDGGGKLRASTSGARWPAWGPRRALYYFNTSRHGLDRARTREEGGRLVIETAEPVGGGGGPRAPAQGRVVVTVVGGRFNVHPSADRILVLETNAESTETPLARPVVVLDWANPLR